MIGGISLMRKKMLLSLFIAVAVCFTATACSSTPAPTETDAVESTPIPTESVEPSATPVESETPTPEPSATARTAIREYKDSFISCNYDSSILLPISIKANGSLTYGVAFTNIKNSLGENKENITSGSCLYVSSADINMKFNNAFSIDYLEAMFSGIFNAEFESEPNTKISSKKNDDGTTESTAVLKDGTILKCKLIACTDASVVTMIVYRLLPGESEDYVTVLNNCYDSVQYINSDNTIISVKDSNKITEGKLFDSVTAVYENVKLTELTSQNMLSISINLEGQSPEENATQFFEIVNNICKNCNLEDSYSIIAFNLMVDNILVSMMNYTNYIDSNTFTSTSPVVVVEEYKDIIEELYNSYNSSNDILKNLEKDIDDIKKKYNLD